MMKYTVLLLLSIISGFFHAQVNSEFHTSSQIDSEIIRAEELSKNNPTGSIELSDKIYHASQKIKYKKGVLESSLMLMARYFDAGNHKKVIDLSTEAEKLAQEAKDDAKLSNIYRLRASSYTELGFNNESISEFRKALKTAEKLTSADKKNYLKALIYTGMGSYSAHVDAPLDSVIYYQKRSLQSTLQIGDSKDFITKKNHLLALSYMNLGMTSVASKRINSAKNYFNKALEIIKNERYAVSKNLEVTVLNEYAWLYYDQKKYGNAVQFAEKAEQLEKAIKIPYIRRDIYEVYFKSYVELGEKEASKKYMNLYTMLNDSLVNEEKKTINTPVKKIMEEQGKIHTGNIQKIMILTLGFITVLVAGGIFFWKRNQKELHSNYTAVIKNLKDINAQPVKIIQPEVSSEKGISITDETVKMILVKLEKFEKSQKFIKKDLSLTSLANDLNTNTRYLSEIIKQYRQNNYNNYINGLRIRYITNMLYENPIYREYKISYLAEASGFSSREVFAVIFKKETGVSPSYFINNLRKDSLESAS
jgi:AraC-like DNA-binding protein/Tfp pilus assembly protein PilF